MNRVAEDVDAGELRPLDALLVMMAMKQSVLVAQQLFDDEEEQHAGEDEQRGPERARPACVGEDPRDEMDERVAEKRAGCAMNSKRAWRRASRGGSWCGKWKRAKQLKAREWNAALRACAKNVVTNHPKRGA
jgi:hypothetical protein